MFQPHYIKFYHICTIYSTCLHCWLLLHACVYVPCSKHHPQEETDAPEEEVDMGKEWPSHENWDVKSYRQFYQSWCGVVQGAYPVEKEVAIKASPFLAITFFPSLVLPPNLFFINPSLFPFHLLFTSPLFPQTPTLLPASIYFMQLAALLTHIYFGDRARYKAWPPEDYE